MKITIRAARPGDTEALLDIYAHYVEHTALSYEYAPPTVEEFRGRINNILKFYPYLLAERDGEVLGYACAGKYREREAYAWNAETTIYLRPDVRGKGIGKILYSRLEEILKAQGAVKLMASVTCPKDEYSDFGSMQFHEEMGYKVAGRLENCGYKFGRWYTTLIMDKAVGVPETDMRPVKSFDEVRENFGL